MPESPEVRTQICRDCSIPLIDANTVMYKGFAHCTDCVVTCGYSECSTKIRINNAYIVGEQLWCETCTNDYAYSCNMCGVRGLLEFFNFQSSGYGSLCSLCIERYFWKCTCDNDRVIKLESYCPHCQKNQEGKKKRCECNKGTTSEPIHNYPCKPRLVFHGKSKQKIHMGFELETMINRGRSEADIRIAAVYAMQQLQPLEIAQLKQDSSIGGGFEIVTQPHTYEKYREQAVLWQTIDTLRTQYKGRSWDTTSCGLHIHVARNGYRDALHIHRFIEFVYRNPEMLMKFAGRKSARYASFADCWTFDEYEQPEFSVDKKLRNRERMSAVNINNTDTLELRFFRGTMLPSGVLAALGLTHAMVQYTRDFVPDVNAPRELVFAWEPFAEWVTARAEQYPELMERLPNIKAINLDNIPEIQA